MLSTSPQSLSSYAHYVPVALLAVVSVFVWGTVYARDGAGVLSIAFLDVGQGDAVFIESPSGNQVLIDGGSGRSVLEALGTLMSPFDRSIDVVVATHPDLDHIGGLPEVFARYDVGMFIDPGVQDSGGDYRALIGAVQTEGLEPVRARSGMTLDLGDGAVLEVIFPDRDVSQADPNAGSVVMRLVSAGTSALFTGDAPATIETYLVGGYGARLKSDLLKLGHHGSRTSSADAFLTAVDPTYGIISAGCDNSYGHPHQEVLDRLVQHAVMQLDTCTEGTIIFRSNGVEWTRT